MGEDGLTGLRTCLANDKWNSVKSKLGVGSKGAPQICDRQFRSIFDLGSLPNYPESMPIQRGRLREVLVSEPQSRALIHFSKVLKSYRIIRDVDAEQIELNFEDDTTATGDLVIAADGSKSILNHLTGLRNRYLTDVRCITARINVSRPEIVRSLPPTLQAGPVMLGLGQRSVCFTSLYLPVLDDPTSIYHKNSTLMWALAVGRDFWQKTLEYDPEDALPQEKEHDLFQTAMALSDHWPESRALQSVLTADPVASIGYGAFRSSKKPSLKWREEVRMEHGPDAGPDRIWFIGDSIHAMTRMLLKGKTNKAGRGMGGNQALRDAGVLAKLIPKMVSNAYGYVTDEMIRDYLGTYEKEMIPRGFKWVQASEEGHDLFDTEDMGRKMKFWMIISIMRVVSLLAMIIFFFMRPFRGERKGLIARVEASQ
jgi:2-polyprenyl-6-methoxyphenol hydroxylase-like FAD-dependent oxidoreductase